MSANLLGAVISLILVQVNFSFCQISNIDSARSKLTSPEYRPFTNGEFLRYNIHYGIIDAGEATFSIQEDLRVIANKSHYSVKVTGKSYRSWDLFYKVRDYYYSYIDTVTMLPTVYSRSVQEGDYADKESYRFYHEEHMANGKNSQGDSELEIPYGVQDLASMLYYARSIKFYEKEEGYKITMNVFFGSEYYQVSAHFDGYEDVKTSIGTFRCMRIVPELIEGRVFKGQNDMVVYVSADRNQIPIRIESEIFVGSIKVDLVEYRNLSFPLESL